MFNVFPILKLHSASISGLKWAAYMHNHIAFVTKTGVFKLIAINFDMKDEFVLLIEHSIANG